MMTVGNSPFSGLTNVILVVALLGTIIGLAVAGTDLFNFNRSAAEVKQLELASEIQAKKKNAIDLGNYEQIKAAETTAELEKINLEVEALRKEYAYTLQAKQRMSQVWMVVGPTVVLILAIALAFFLIQRAQSYQHQAPIQAQAQTGQHDKTATVRENKILWHAVNFIPNKPVSVNGENGHHPVKAPSGAGV